ncbi:hypothetical protein FOIG_05953 [Fusarium odoratissimum NRRL 54006]|nr:uncharacterized protein FOIG_05953 [Fusarium odoratissimum NRRL 54006]EXM03034.1 hypothetical protein FOIG_05953 [Fusarium odoratissimum NRRL 54006]TXC11712.1 hypothetical protein FocTR4_00007199 [Fusarium oxysporum f. sp. cubense]
MIAARITEASTTEALCLQPGGASKEMRGRNVKIESPLGESYGCRCSFMRWQASPHSGWDGWLAWCDGSASADLERQALSRQDPEEAPLNMTTEASAGPQLIATQVNKAQFKSASLEAALTADCNC